VQIQLGSTLCSTTLLSVQWQRWFVSTALHYAQGRNEGARGAQFPMRRITIGALNHYRGAPKSSKNVTTTFFNTVHLLPNDLKFEHGCAKLASCLLTVTSVEMPPALWVCVAEFSTALDQPLNKMELRNE